MGVGGHGGGGGELELQISKLAASLLHACGKLVASCVLMASSNLLHAYTTSCRYLSLQLACCMLVASSNLLHTYTTS